MRIDKKKIAMMIVSGLGDHYKKDEDFESKDEPKKESKEEDKPKTNYGLISTAEELIKSIKEGSAEDVVKALINFNELTTGVEFQKHKED